MADIQINSFFLRGMVPATDINTVTPGFPSIRIWQINGSSYDLVVGSPSGSGQNTDGVMSVVTDSGQEDGFYSFQFTDSIGYDPTQRYLVRVYAGSSIASNDRYQTAELSPEISPANVAAIADAVWDEPVASHNAVGSTGLTLSQAKANTETLVLSVGDVLDIVNLVLKYDTNRTRINTSTKQLIVYDDDCTTILRAFQLYDSTGTPSTDSVCERVPVAASDGHPICP